MARQRARHRMVLSFLRDEVWSSSQVLTVLLGGSPALTSKTMSQLERRGYVLRHQLEPLRQLLWGITPHGLAHAWDDEQMQFRAYFEPSKLSALAVPHHLDIQYVRLKAQSAGWSNWTPEALLPRGLAKRPDATVLDPAGRKIAVEIERRVKTVKRYEAIFSVYLQAIKRGEYDQVHYIVSDNKLAARLQRVFGLIKSVPVLGERIQLTEKHRARFTVVSLSDWTCCQGPAV
ncbi:MAG: MobC family replication-relaxation protein [Moraxellaceae bacterium]|nr:MobC family replication-relaxation protein [Moraxellaceae bacterium]MDP1776223.1 MobC family replication-relaxation protein [Moraxellaceae bacterium]